jgi:Acyl-CoA carboxylase epsilon subunit
MSSDDDEAERRPVLRVIRGDATDEEIAALLTVIAARVGSATAADAGPDRPISAWGDRAAALRRAQHPGPGAWRASAWQR